MTQFNLQTPQEYTIRTFELTNIYTVNYFWYGSRLFIDGKDIWIPHLEGALKFDGETWEKVDNSNGLLGTSVEYITKDTDNRLWFANQEGISIKDSASWIYYPNENDTISGMKRVGEHILVGKGSYSPDKTSTNLIGKNDTISLLPSPNIYGNEGIKTIARTRDRIYSYSSNSLYSWRDNSWSADTIFTNYNLRGLHIDRKERITLLNAHYSDNTSVLMISNESQESFRVVPIPYKGSVSKLIGDNDGNVYMKGDNGIISYNIETNIFSKISLYETENSDVLDIGIDSNKNLWILTEGYSLPEYNYHVRLHAILYNESNDPALIHGLVYHDINNNGIKEENENGVPNHLIKTTPNEQISISDEEGKFIVSPTDGANTVTWLAKSFWSKGVTPTVFNITSPQDNGKPLEIGLKLNSVTDAAVSISGSAVRPGFDTHYTIVVKNEGSDPTQPMLTMKYDSSLTFLQSSVTPSIVKPNELTWSLAEIPSLESSMLSLTFNVAVKTKLDDRVSNVVSVKILAAEIDQIDNSEVIKQRVTGSLDPNDKLVAEGVLAERYVEIGNTLTYTIRFQNTGTDTAFFVKIKDQLDPKLNLQTLEVLQTSHPATYLLDGRTLIFNFNNIKLVDSIANEPASHGFVKYRIGHIAPLANETLIKNTAAIYFDFSEPVLTNEVSNLFVNDLPVNQITSNEGKHENNLDAYPNPVTDYLYVKDIDISFHSAH